MTYLFTLIMNNIMSTTLEDGATGFKGSSTLCKIEKVILLLEAYPLLGTYYFRRGHRNGPIKD